MHAECPLCARYASEVVRLRGRVGRSTGFSRRLETSMSVQAQTVVPAVVDPGPFSDRELFALAGFLAGYSGLTYEAYALDLRQYASYCAQHRLALFDARRVHIETFARHLEAAGKARATIARRLCTVTCFYRYAEQEGLIATSPAVHVRRPRLDYESHATGLDRNELGAMLVVVGLASPRDHADRLARTQRAARLRGARC
jgi:integrase